MPVLWDKKEQTIVNNESSEIIRIFNSSFNNLAKNPGTALSKVIDNPVFVESFAGPDFKQHPLWTSVWFSFASRRLQYAMV